MNSHNLLYFLHAFSNFMLNYDSKSDITIDVTKTKENNMMYRNEYFTSNHLYIFDDGLDPNNPYLKYSYDVIDFYVMLNDKRQWIGGGVCDLSDHNLIPFLEDIVNAQDDVEYIERVEDLLHNVKGSVFPMNDRVKSSPLYSDREFTFDNGTLYRFSVGPKTTNIVRYVSDF